MNNEFYEHKKSDAVKWIIVFVLIGVLFAGMIASLVMSAPDKTEILKQQCTTRSLSR